MIVTGWAGGYLVVCWTTQIRRSTKESTKNDTNPSQGAPIAGYFLDAYGGSSSTLVAYHPAMFYAGGMALVLVGMV